tara:strand:- start:7 stop:231 length:225 start_codon:yes stop_codon:yes gene_type:complete
MVLHYNEVELQNQLKSYLETQLEINQHLLDRELKDYQYSENWLEENKVRVEKIIQSAQLMVNFYQTQLDNLNTK